MTTNKPTKNIPYLDGWRGLAILLVLQSHFGLGGGGRLGVALFFALSGYLMGELLFVKQVALPGFFKRRFSRVVPTFWLLAVAINYLDCAPALLHRGLSLGPLRWFGICSFSLYIWQQPFYDAYLHGHLQRQVAGVLALIVASIAFYLYEDPVRRRLNNGSRRAMNALPVQAERGVP